MRNYDLDFLKRFSLIIGFLTVVTFGLIALSYFVHKSLPGEVDPGVAKRTADRIAPVGGGRSRSASSGRRPSAGWTSGS